RWRAPHTLFPYTPLFRSHDPHPVAPEEPEEHERRCEVGRDEEGDEVLVVLVDVPAQQARKDDAVAEARDREELRHALEQPEEDRSEEHTSELQSRGQLVC